MVLRRAGLSASAGVSCIIYQYCRKQSFQFQVISTMTSLGFNFRGPGTTSHLEPADLVSR